jgi:NAD dependent epimerase/dehydratase family enzyme
MAVVRRLLGAGFGPPLPRWMLEIGAMGMRTETELILKSRWVIPEKLTLAGFEFAYSKLEDAVRESFDLRRAA